MVEGNFKMDGPTFILLVMILVLALLSAIK